MFTSQSGNRAKGDIVAGNQTNITNVYAPAGPLSHLYEQLRHPPANPGISDIADQLRHFCSAVTDGDVRGLEEKLTSAGRTDLIPAATYLKETATKLIMRWQTSRAAQDIITFILSHMYKNYLLHVQPAIEADHPRTIIDSLISEKVIEPAEQMLGENALSITSTDLLGLVFFLGGNCHIRWDKC